jgi:hypothetical protein
MSFIIPDLVRNEVQSVAFSLRQTVQRVCSGISSSATGGSRENHLLDAPSYLFVSTYAFPSLPSPSIPFPHSSFSSSSFSRSLIGMLPVTSPKPLPAQSSSPTTPLCPERSLTNGRHTRTVSPQESFIGSHLPLHNHHLPIVASDGSH